MHYLNCFYNKQTFFFFRNKMVKSRFEKTQTELMMSVTCLRCTIVSPTADKIKAQLLSRGHKACWGLAMGHRSSDMSDTSLALAAPSSWRTSAPLLLVRAVLSSKPKPNDCSLEPPQKVPSEGISPQSKGHRIVLRYIILRYCICILHIVYVYTYVYVYICICILYMY